MRDVAVTEGDKVEAQLRFGVSVNTYGVNDLVAAVDAVADADVDDAGRGVRRPLRRRARAAARRRPARVAALRRPHRARAARVPRRRAASAPSPPTSRTSAGCASCPGLAVQRLMADGYGFGGEGDWKTSVAAAHAQGDGRRAARRHVASWRTTPTTWCPARRLILGAHMLEVCPTIAAGQPTLEIHPLGIGGREDPVRLVFDADARRRPSCVGLADMGDRFRLRRQRDRRRPARRSRCPNLPVARAVWQPRARPAHLRRGLADRRRPAPHGAVHRAVGAEELDDLAEMPGTELVLIDADTTVRQLRQGAPLEPGLLPAGAGL